MITAIFQGIWNANSNNKKYINVTNALKQVILKIQTDYVKLH